MGTRVRFNQFPKDLFDKGSMWLGSLKRNATPTETSVSGEIPPFMRGQPNSISPFLEIEIPLIFDLATKQLSLVDNDDISSIVTLIGKDQSHNNHQQGNR